MRLVRGELLKLVTTRALLAFAAIGIALTAANVVIIAVASGVLDEVGEKEQALGGMPIVLLLFGVVGAAGEYRHRTAAPAALVAGCSRRTLLLARTAAYALGGLGIGALMVGVSVGLGLPLLADHPGPVLTTQQVLGVAGGDLAAFVLFAIIGAAVGALVRNQVTAVVSVLIFNFLLSPLLGTADEQLGNLTPFGAADVLVRQTQNTTLSVGAAAILLFAWTVFMVVITMLGERRRDLA